MANQDIYKVWASLPTDLQEELKKAVDEIRSGIPGNGEPEK
jgi:hypothetical protein